MPGERRLYQIFKDKLHKEDQNAWIYKIPDTFGIGGKRPFDTIAIVQGVAFAIEFKAKDGELIKYQAFQLQEFLLAGGESRLYWENLSDMDSFIAEIMKTVKEKKK
jgi:hypothetical protein